MMNRIALCLIAGCASEVGTVGDEPMPPPPILEDSDAGTCLPELCDTSCMGGDIPGSSLVAGVNRADGLLADWAPSDLVHLPIAYRTGAGDWLRTRAATSFARMADASLAAGFRISCGSSYRSFETQCSLFAMYAGQDGCQVASSYSARAGHSEHQLGTTCDVFVDGTFLQANTATSGWLEMHAAEYGYVMSYPLGTQCYTLYRHEPWHYRYVGVTAAAQFKNAEAKAGRRMSTHELIETIVPTFDLSLRVQIWDDAAESDADAALLCEKYQMSTCAANGRLVRCGATPEIVRCLHGCYPNPPGVADTCS